MFRRLGASIRKWMYGRYGSDQLNMLLLVLAVILSLTNTILTYALRTSTVYRGIIAPILSLLMYGLLILAMVRMFSRNLSRRERENPDYSLDDLPPIPLKQKVVMAVAIALVVALVFYLIWFNCAH